MQSEYMLYAGAGLDRLQGYGGADDFIFSGAEVLDGNVNRVVDFDVSDNDQIILKDLLIDYDPTSDLISDFIEISSSSHTYISVDRDGSGTEYASEQVVGLRIFLTSGLMLKI